MAYSTEKFKKTYKARPLMLQGTSSGAGKSLITAAFCRILRNLGLKVAPFKSQNMALNSCVTSTGGEIGRAQALQALACRISPTVDMNPVLLKPSGDSVSQVIIQGRVFGSMSAVEYHRFKPEATRFVLESFERLAREYDVIVIEGAGSPAEINLRSGDIANMGIAELVDSPVLIVGDIDRGGVFASLVGTMELLSPGERDRVKGFIINKFRGDKSLLEPAFEFMRNKTGKPVLGVVPFLKGINLPEEDGAVLDGNTLKNTGDEDIRIAVIKLPRISNFTDFDPFSNTPGVRLDYIESPDEAAGADMVILPGTKNTLSDLEWLRGQGFEKTLRDYFSRGGMIAGVCGGFQMLGARIEDPFGVESALGTMDGLGFFDYRTTLMKDKSTFQVEGSLTFDGSVHPVNGYEIHMGVTEHHGTRFASIRMRNGEPASVIDGAISDDSRVWGTYIHGIFDNDSFREALVNRLRTDKGLSRLENITGFKESLEASMEALALCVAENIDLEQVLKITGVSKCSRP